MTILATFNKARFSSILRATIKNRRVRQKDVAEAIGVAEFAVSRWLNTSYTTMPDLNNFFALCDFLKINPNSFLLGVDEIEDGGYRANYDSQMRVIHCYTNNAHFMALVDDLSKLPDKKLSEWCAGFLLVFDAASD